MVVIDGINYLTVEEVCQMLDVKPATIYAYVSRGVLRSYKQGIKRQRLYREDEIQRLLVIRPPNAGAPPTAAEPPPISAASAAEPVVHAHDELPDASSWMNER